MGTDDVRGQSLSILAARGLTVPESLPIIEASDPRAFEEIVERLFCLNAVAATAHGLDASKALSWLHHEQLDKNLTPPERSFLQQGQGNRDAFKVQVEGMWALAWVVSIVPEIDFWRDCSSNFVRLLPNLKTGEGVTRTTNHAKLRASDQITAALDLYYCLHWIVRDALINGAQMPRDLKPYVIVERRRALEWVLGEDAWHTVNVDT